jgi:hypothetical protein
MAEIKNNKQQKANKVKKDLEGLSERAKKSRLKLSDLIIPIGSLVVLLILSIFVFIPMINTANEYRRELKDVNEKLETLDELENSLNDIDDTQLVSDLLVAKKIIPKVLQVSDFVYYIDNLAKSKNLETREISAGDVNIGGSEQTRVQESLGVRGPLSYSGSYGNVLDFLDEIQGYSPYLVTLSDISMQRSDENVWSVDFNLTGYYIPEREMEPSLYMPFSKYSQFSDIIDIFSVRVQRLDE